ncbi:MAG: Asp-tRNA(Asn)/Glu-tRNA(Gln) amidotransferase subunit GatC [Candidatus Bathyarchaeota archaeon]|nr:Asp-tRNA(Asn)/Glu-tRNA(Gln) amidotransferase subunit GatC [Candidatus Bathyarchaeota archaeon]
MKPTQKPHISRKEVEHVAWLAHIELTEEEKTLFTEQFNKILDYFRKIDEAETEDVDPTYHVLDLVNIFRKDEAEESLPREEPLKNAPKTEDGFFKSPRIV